jgi:hypothetical protein
MKPNFLLFLLVAHSFDLHGQGTFIVDQQSSRLLDAASNLQYQPIGQFFTPATSSLNTVVLELSLLQTANVSVYVNVRSSTFDGSIIASSLPTLIQSTSPLPATFSFATDVSLQPGSQYFLQALVLSGGQARWWESFGPYSGGAEIYNGHVVPYSALWFQEGITIVPEPSALWLSMAGAGGMVFWRKRLGSRL